MILEMAANTPLLGGVFPGPNSGNIAQQNQEMIRQQLQHLQMQQMHLQQLQMQQQQQLQAAEMLRKAMHNGGNGAGNETENNTTIQADGIKPADGTTNTNNNSNMLSVNNENTATGGELNNRTNQANNDVSANNNNNNTDVMNNMAPGGVMNMAPGAMPDPFFGMGMGMKTDNNNFFLQTLQRTKESGSGLLGSQHIALFPGHHQNHQPQQTPNMNEMPGNGRGAWAA